MKQRARMKPIYDARGNLDCFVEIRNERRGMFRRIATQAAHYLTLQAFLGQRGVNVFTSLQTVSVSFETKTAADEFERFLREAKRR